MKTGNPGFIPLGGCVFHVGGINFFSDKARAIREMLRVAKPGSKIIIADETSDFIDQQYKKAASPAAILSIPTLIWAK